MRTYLFITDIGESLGLAHHIHQQGDKVLFYIHDRRYKQVGIGLIDHIDTLDDILSHQPDLVIFDSVNPDLTKYAIRIEKTGIPVYGVSSISNAMYNDLSYAKKFLNLNGISTDVKDNSIYVVYSSFLNGKSVVSSSIFFEYHRFMNGGIGQITYMGSVGLHVQSRKLESKLSSFMQALVKTKFSGQVDLRLAISGNDIACREISFFNNQLTTPAFFQNAKVRTGDFLYSMAIGDTINPRFKSQWTYSMTLMKLPMSDPELINGINNDNEKHLWYMEVSKDDSRTNLLPLRGYALTIVSRGDILREARRRTNRTLSNIQLEDKLYRTDIGHDVIKKCERLNQEGYTNVNILAETTHNASFRQAPSPLSRAPQEAFSSNSILPQPLQSANTSTVTLSEKSFLPS